MFHSPLPRSNENRTETNIWTSRGFNKLNITYIVRVIIVKILNWTNKWSLLIMIYFEQSEQDYRMIKSSSELVS